MIGASADWPIAARIALSGFAGVVAAVLLLLVIALSRHPVLPDGSLPAAVLQAVAIGMTMVLFGLILTGPLILIAIVSGVLLRRSIARHLLPWSLFAPVIVWLFVCVMGALTRRNPYFATHDFPDRLGVTMRDPENLLYLTGAAVAGIVFYLLSARRRDRTAE